MKEQIIVIEYDPINDVEETIKYYNLDEEDEAKEYVEDMQRINSDKKYFIVQKPIYY